MRGQSCWWYIGFGLHIVGLAFFTCILLVSLWLIFAHPASADVQYVPAKRVTITYYHWTGNRMANGEYPFIGAAACSTDIRMGTVVLFPDGRVVVCSDRGHLGNRGWIDIYADSREAGREIARTYGSETTVSLFVPD